jgi:hypothetical protein
LCVNATDHAVTAQWLGATVVIKPIALFVSQTVSLWVQLGLCPMAILWTLVVFMVGGIRKSASESISSMLCKSNRGSQQLAQAA